MRLGTEQNVTTNEVFMSSKQLAAHDAKNNTVTRNVTDIDTSFSINCIKCQAQLN